MLKISRVNTDCPELDKFFSQAQYTAPMQSTVRILIISSNWEEKCQHGYNFLSFFSVFLYFMHSLYMILITEGEIHNYLNFIIISKNLQNYIILHVLNIQVSIQNQKAQSKEGQRCIILQTVCYFNKGHYDSAFLSTRPPLISFKKL